LNDDSIFEQQSASYLPRCAVLATESDQNGAGPRDLYDLTRAEESSSAILRAASLFPHQEILLGRDLAEFWTE
jgi:hypothetical protein